MPAVLLAAHGETGGAQNNALLARVAAEVTAQLPDLPVACGVLSGAPALEHSELHKIANALLEYETLTGDELRALQRGEDIDRPEPVTEPPEGKSTRNLIVPSAASTRSASSPGRTSAASAIRARSVNGRSVQDSARSSRRW